MLIPSTKTSSDTLVLSKQPCPNCPSSDAYHEWADGHGHCFSCEYHKPPTDYDRFSELNDATYEYLPLRGIDKDTLKFYNVKTKIDKDGKPISLGFEYPNDGVKVRSLSEKNFYWTADSQPAKVGLFGRDKFNEGDKKYITITEGELDALSLYQVLQGPVVSVQSSVTAARDCSVDRSFLNSYERIYLCFDADAPGREATTAVARLFDYHKVFHVKLSKRKDANEYLTAGEADELKRIWWNSKNYLPDTLVSSFSEFEEEFKKEPKVGVPYPFKTLTDMTYGIRTGETVLITAQEKVGKTEVMHAIEYQLLQKTDCNIGAIYLEEPKLRHLQAISGIHLKKPIHLPDAGVTPVEAFNALKEAVRFDDRLHVYSNFGSDNPDVFLDLVRFLVTSRNCRYILFDHLSMVVSGSIGSDDERRTLDYLSTRLEMMVKELDFALILVSHVNDAGQTRGSRYLTKVSDITINLTRDTLAPDTDTRNTIALTIPYNRFCGRTGSAGSVRYNPSTGTLTEVFDVQDSNRDNNRMAA